MDQFVEFNFSRSSEISFEAFVAVLAQWTLTPEKMWKGVLSCRLEDDDDATMRARVESLTDAFELSHKVWSDEINLCVGRTLLPRFEEKDDPVKEEVVFDFANRSMTLKPILESPEDARKLPLFYPKITEFTVTYTDSERVDESKASTSSGTSDSQDCENVDGDETSAKVQCTLGVRARMHIEQDETNMKQLCSRYLTTLHKWGRNQMKPGGYKKKSFHDQLVAFPDYLREYKRMKLKYRYWVEQWPEKTDAKKFVFEDIAIATFLMCLWRQEAIGEQGCASTEASSSSSPESDSAPNRKSQYFVDLGCGNGFLTYLLTSEGYRGCGIDLQKRKIWDCYDIDVDLRQSSVDPSALKFPDADWILANHADELSIWVPVIAFRSSRNTKFWNLPCCFYGFSGGRFRRTNSSVSQYQGFLEYLRHLTKVCGFKFEQDMMRIPSTKNVAHFGRRRAYTHLSEALQDAKEEEIERAISAELSRASFAGFTARENPSKLV